MGYSRRDVGGYRGRRTITDILRFIAILLAVLVVVLLAGMFYLQRYVVYTDEGAKLELPPFLQFLRHSGEQPSDNSVSPPDLGNVSFVEDPDGSLSEPGDASQGEEESRTPGFAMELPVSDVVNGLAGEKLEQAGAEALILEMKDREGMLAWHSEQEVAGRAKVNGEPSANETLRQWNQGEVYTVARLCCFQDNSVPYYHNKMALRQGNGNWRDELGLRWMSPAHADAQAYIAGLCGELAALGFDEIVLENFSFPVGERTARINQGENYDSARFSLRLEELLTQVQGAVEPYGTKISLRVGADLLENTGLSGLSPDLLDRFGYRFWTGQAGIPALSSLSEDMAQRVVEIVPQAEENRSQFQAVYLAEE